LVSQVEKWRFFFSYSMTNLLEKFLKENNVSNEYTDAKVSNITSSNKDANTFSELISHSDKYASSNKNGSLNQYFNIYNNRLAHFKPKILKNTAATFGSALKPTAKVLDIQPTLLSQSIKHDQPKNSIKPNALTFAVGTIYTEMKYKPDILNQVSKDIYGMPETLLTILYKAKLIVLSTLKTLKFCLKMKVVE